jgi:hypothetical protein
MNSSRPKAGNLAIYAAAMAIWGAFVAVSGFYAYHGHARRDHEVGMTGGPRDLDDTELVDMSASYLPSSVGATSAESAIGDHTVLVVRVTLGDRVSRRPAREIRSAFCSPALGVEAWVSGRDIRRGDEGCDARSGTRYGTRPAGGPIPAGGLLARPGG